MNGRQSTPLLLFVAGALGAAACAQRQEERGRQLYVEHGCAVCHGTGGRGDGPSAQRLDAPPRDFADGRAYRQGADEDTIAGSIRRGTGGMPAFRDLSESEARDIAAWIGSLQRTGRPAGEP